MTEYKIVNAEKITIEGKEFIDVEVEFSSEVKDPETRRYNFPLTTTAKEIEAEFKQQCAVIDTEYEVGVASLKLEEENKVAEETIGELLGEEKKSDKSDSLKTNKKKK